MFAMPTTSTPSDRSKLITTVGHVSIVVVFCVVLAAMGLTAAPAASDADEAVTPVPTARGESKLRARRIPSATWAPATTDGSNSAACAPSPSSSDPRQLVCRSFSLLELEPLSELDLSAPATSSCGRTITLWTY